MNTPLFELAFQPLFPMLYSKKGTEKMSKFELQISNPESKYNYPESKHLIVIALSEFLEAMYSFHGGDVKKFSKFIPRRGKKRRGEIQDAQDWIKNNCELDKEVIVIQDWNINHWQCSEKGIDILAQRLNAWANSNSEKQNSPPENGLPFDRIKELVVAQRQVASSIECGAWEDREYIFVDANDNQVESRDIQHQINYLYHLFDERIRYVTEQLISAFTSYEESINSGEPDLITRSEAFLLDQKYWAQKELMMYGRLMRGVIPCLIEGPGYRVVDPWVNPRRNISSSNLEALRKLSKKFGNG